MAWLSNGFKRIPIVRLREILANLPDDGFVRPNTVGNITVQDKDGADIGFIDIADEEYVPFE